MHPLIKIIDKPSRLVIGIMSGTSADGIDTVLCRISGNGTNTKVENLGFYFEAFSKEIREKILSIAKGESTNSKEFCKMNFLLSHLYVDACKKLCDSLSISYEDIDLIGSHGQTVWHIPIDEEYLGRKFTSTLQIGDTSLLAEEFSCVAVGDFRVRDVAAGGFGAPLVPYSEFLLYRSETENIALQNIGGIGNISFLPAAANLEDLFAFDTGPGNMLIDAVYTRISDGKYTYDEDGNFAKKGKVDEKMLEFLMQDDYVNTKPPKTTGREYYGENYVEKILAFAKKNELVDEDLVATVTAFTAKSIAYSIEQYLDTKPDKLIVGGGGARNSSLMKYLRYFLPDIEVLRNEDLGFDSDAKEAIAFAILANESIFANANNVPSVTGARHPVVMGKISF